MLNDQPSWPTHSPNQATSELSHSINDTKAINIAAIFATSGIAVEAPIDAASTTFVASNLSGFLAFVPRNRERCRSGYKIFEMARAPGADMTQATIKSVGEMPMRM